MNLDEKTLALIEKEVLLNATLYEGKPNPKAVMGKILGKHKELRKLAKELMPAINKVAKQIEGMDLNQIKQKLDELDPDAVNEHKKKKEEKADKRREQKKELPDLPEAIEGKVVLRYAPDPSKYPHIGQGMNYLINRIYADKYKGKVVLRFDDTNPKIVKPIYYEAIKNGMIWLGATWDEEINASSLIEEFYEVAREWIKKENVYICLCEAEEMRDKRDQGKICQHRSQSSEENMELFEKMLAGQYKPGEAIVRLLGDMKSENNVMRDPIMFRVVDQQHPMLDQFYHVFPTYDFESPYLDFKYGITHIVRSGEFGTMRQEMQSFIIEKLGGKVPIFKSFGRFNIQGCPTKGRVIRELVQSKIVTGWDDIRLITLAGLQNRGVHPMTPRLLIEEAGLTPKNTNIAWATFEKKSKELLEPVAKRFFFVENPIKMEIENNAVHSVDIPYHPEITDYGARIQELDNFVFVAKLDVKNLKMGDTIRLKQLYNVEVLSTSEDLIKVKAIGEEIIPGVQIIQWVGKEGMNGELLVPDLLEKQKGKINENSLSIIKGMFEPNINKVSDKEVIQLERVGYAKISVIENNYITGHIVHL